MVQSRRAAEGRAGRGQRLVVIHPQFGAVGGEAGQKRRGDRAGEIAAERRRAEQQDFRLVRVDQLGQALGIGLVAIVLKDRVLDRVDDVGAIGEGFLGRVADVFARRAHDHAAQFDAELIGQLAAFAEQFEGDGMDDAALHLDKHPHVLVVAELLGKLLLHRSAAAACLRRGRGFRIAHVQLLKKSRESPDQNPAASLVRSASIAGILVKMVSIRASAVSA